MATPKQLDLTVQNRLKERTLRTLEKRELALKHTLEEIELVGQNPDAHAALPGLRVKRDRQHGACESAKAILKALG